MLVKVQDLLRSPSGFPDRVDHIDTGSAGATVLVGEQMCGSTISRISGRRKRHEDCVARDSALTIV
jgi:hypothetical protein